MSLHIHYQRPSKALQRFIQAYVLVDDRRGALPHMPLQTVPMPLGALSVNFCELSLDTTTGQLHPEVALLGVQTSARHWVSGASTLFVMVLLTPRAMLALFPRMGAATGNGLCDLRDLLGRRQVEGLRAAAGAFLGPGHPTTLLDGWAASVLFGEGPLAGEELMDVLAGQGQPGAAASALGMSLRTYERRFREGLGVTPTELVNLERLQRSMRAVRCPGEGRQEVGFADQSHEIRHWRRYLGTSPGRYRLTGGSRLARAMDGTGQEQAVFYL